MTREQLKELIRREIREAFMPIDMHRVSGRHAYYVGANVRRTLPDEKKYILKDKTTGSYYGGNDLQTPTLVNKNSAMVVTGEKMNDIKNYDWQLDWTEEEVGEVNELHFTGETLNKVRQDVFDFISTEHKKLGYANPLDTYKLIQQVLDSTKISGKVKGIR